MALAATMVWEVRTGGSNNNGGGFKAGAAGTDRSQQDAAHVVFDGTTVKMTSSGTTATVTLTGHTGVAADVGNVVNVTGGTNATAGLYEITAASSTTWTLDRNWCSGAVTNGAGNMGGAFATPQKAFTAMTVAGQSTWIKSGTYTTATGWTFAFTSGGISDYVVVRGYTSTRGDRSTRPILRATAGSFTVVALQASIFLDNLEIDGNSQTSIRGVAGGDYNGLFDCVVRNCTNSGIVLSTSYTKIARCEVTGCTTSGAAVNGCTLIEGCYIHDNTVAGISGSPYSVIDCVVANNTGASSDGINLTNNFIALVTGNTVHGNGRHGIIVAYTTMSGPIVNNLITNNGGYGLAFGNSPTNSTSFFFQGNYNAFRSNTSGSRQYVQAGDHDVTLSADPYTDAAGGDFSLNNTAGGGAACRAAGFPGVFPGGTTTGYRDIGAIQHQDAGGSSGARLVGPSALITPGGCF